MSDVDVDGLRNLGLSDLTLDLNNIVAYYNYINRVANGLGLSPRSRRALARRCRAEWRFQLASGSSRRAERDQRRDDRRRRGDRT
jgi:hypothetical protein